MSHSVGTRDDAVWDLTRMPDQSGRTVLVTGVTSGIGTHTARQLARAGARVVLAARSEEKLDATEAELRREVRDAETERLLVDLADLSSVRRAADAARTLGPIDVLVNNAGVMATPHQRTADGLELQMATNHFGPFLLTGLLLDQLAASGDGRIVTVSSLMHRTARSAPLGDPRSRGRYQRWLAYGQSKLANLLFTFEAQRRLTAADVPVGAVAAHPGFAATHLASTGQAGGRRVRGLQTSVLDGVIGAVAQPAEMGALPTLMAATADLPGGSYCGPGGFRQMQGRPRLVGTSALARDEAAQQRLWEISEETVGLHWP